MVSASGSGGCLPLGPRGCLPLGLLVYTHTPRHRLVQMAIKAAGTHPTGMLSCFYIKLR